MMIRAGAIGLFAVFATSPLGANAQTARDLRAFAANPPKGVALQVTDRRMSERMGYKRVSSLVDFPSFFPGIGALYVQPKSVPNGPYRAFDRKGRLSSTIYMIPIADFEARKKFDLAGLAGPGDHVTFYFNSGHPGLDEPHYHIHIWHVSRKGEARVAR